MILLGLRMLSSQGPLQTGAQIRTTVTFVAFRNAQGTFNSPLNRNSKSVKEKYKTVRDSLCLHVTS